MAQAQSNAANRYRFLCAFGLLILLTAAIFAAGSTGILPLDNLHYGWQTRKCNRIVIAELQYDMIHNQMLTVKIAEFKGKDAVDFRDHIRMVPRTPFTKHGRSSRGNPQLEFFDGDRRLLKAALLKGEAIRFDGWSCGDLDLTPEAQGFLRKFSRTE